MFKTENKPFKESLNDIGESYLVGSIGNFVELFLNCTLL
jgi:hypothetical protein